MSHVLKPETSRKDSPSLVQSVNEEFNTKLIMHGTENGVPRKELPTAKGSSFVSQKSGLLGSHKKRLHLALQPGDHKNSQPENVSY